MVFPCRSLSKEAGLSERHRVTSVSALLPAPRVSSHALVSLSHTLLITAMAGLLSQKNVFFLFSFLGATCLHEAALRSYILILRRNLSAFDSKLCRWSLRLLRRMCESVCLLFFRGNLKKYDSSLDFHSGGSPELPSWRWHPSPTFLPRCSLALSGQWPHSFTQLFIILISILPFPSSCYLSLPLSLSLSLSLPPLN